ncbi:MAG: zf-HC2 domain-containing protein [Gemmatimonadales bacterium]
MRPHVPEEEFHAYADGELSTAQRAEIAEHLLACLICRSMYGEVQEVRARASRLLAIAAPRVIRRSALPSRTSKSIRTWMGGVAAASIAVVGLSSYLALQPVPANTSSTRLAAAFVAPTIFAKVGSPMATTPDEPAPLSAEQRTLTLASRAVIRPQVVGPAPTMQVTRRFRPVEPLAELDPSAGWESLSWEAAMALAHGSIARLEGYAVAAVRIQRSANGGRPTFLVRHQLPDGRSLWVVEGQVEDVGPVHQLLEASGLSMSIPVRAKPDYIGTDDDPKRTIRMVTIAGYLPSDSLDAMMGKLTLQ